MVSRFFTPIYLTPYHLAPIYSPLHLLTLYILTPLTFHPDFNLYKIKNKKLAIYSFGHASQATAMPQRPVGLDMKLSQPNVGLIYPLNYDKTCL